MAEVSNDLVKRGFWINWSYGRVLGATITTDTATGNLIIALLALAAATGAGHLWSLILFAIYQSRAARKSGTAIFHQEQAIYRSLQAPSLILVDIMKLLLSWRRNSKIMPWRHLVSIVLLACMFGIGAIMASVFSSRIVETSNIQVLISTTRCWVDLDFSSVDYFSDITRYASAYADKCYNNQTSSLGCDFFVQPQVPLSLTNLSCPLSASNLCIGTNPTAVAFDSGLLDSNEVLGINEPPANRILLRKRTTYAPLKVEDRVSIINASEAKHLISMKRPPLPEEELFSVNYNMPVEQNSWLPNKTGTLIYSAATSNVTEQYVLQAIANYSTAHNITIPRTTFPIMSQLFMTDADSVLLFVFSNSVYSHDVIDDPVFSAHRPRFCTGITDSPYSVNCTYTAASSTSSSITYIADNPVGVLLGLEQYQLCLANAVGQPSTCTNFSGAMQGYVTELLPTANRVQLATLKLLASMVSNLNLQGIVNPSLELKASATVRYGRNFRALPRDQWVTEAIGFESTIWAAIQYMVAMRTSMSQNDTSGLTFANNTASPTYCSPQKVLKNGGFANINVFGLAVTIAISGLFTIINITLLRSLIFLSRIRKALVPRVDGWIQDGVLQLQRRVYESKGFGPWQNVEDEEVPIYLGQSKLPTIFDTNEIRGLPSTFSTTLTNFSNDFEPHTETKCQGQPFDFELTTQADSAPVTGFWTLDNDKRTNLGVLLTNNT